MVIQHLDDDNSDVEFNFNNVIKTNNFYFFCLYQLSLIHTLMKYTNQNLFIILHANYD